MKEFRSFSIESEIGKPYDLQVAQVVSTHSEALLAALTPKGETSNKCGQFQIGDFASFLMRTIPLYLIEQTAPSHHLYNSLRGAGYTEIMLSLASKYLQDKGAINAIKLGHEFRASTNALDAVVDESGGMVTRKQIKADIVSEGFRRTKSIFFDNLKHLAAQRKIDHQDLKPIGNSARRFQIHQDLYLDLSIMKACGLKHTNYLKNISRDSPVLTREHVAFLTVMGIDAETLFIDSAVPMDGDLSNNQEVRWATFWAGVTGTFSDQWADVLQDACSGSDNLFLATLDEPTKNRVIEKLGPIVDKADRLLKNPSFLDRVKFLELQVSTLKLLRKLFPDSVKKYEELVTKAFSQIPEKYRKKFLPTVWASRDLVTIYQLSDFLFHKDKFEEQIKTSSGHRT